MALAKFAVAKLTSVNAFRGKRGLRVNIGCGSNPLADYTNVDLLKGPDIFFWDCRKSLPF
jgi:hypothetical protein